MRRTATTPHRTFQAVVLIGLLMLLPYSAFAGPRNQLIIRVKQSANAQAIANRHGLHIRKSVGRNAGDGIVVVEGSSATDLKNALHGEPDVLDVEDNAIIPLDDDNGETVLPLDDNGETVLPLGMTVMPLDDNGETVLPLDDNGETVLPLDDNGETVLPLEIRRIKAFYNRMAQLLVPSKHLLIQTSLINIGLYDEALQATGRGVVVADLDTGADSCHPVLAGIFQLNFAGDNTPNNAPAAENCATASTTHVPGFGHGTAVASMIRVVAPEAKLWSFRVFDNTGTAQVSDVYEAIVYAVDHGADVINMSFGTSVSSPTLRDAIRYAAIHGVVMVAAGGNLGTEGLMYPAAYTSVTGVVAVNANDIKATFSNYSRTADVSAPGVNLWVAYPNRKLSRASGTSYASPLVAGEAALILDAYSRNHSGSESASDVSRAIRSGVDSIDRLNPRFWGKLGTGRMDIPSAVNNH